MHSLKELKVIAPRGSDRRASDAPSTRTDYDTDYVSQWNNGECDSTQQRVLDKDLIVFYEIVEGKPVVNLKENGCNTNVLMQSFVKRNEELIN